MKYLAFPHSNNTFVTCRLTITWSWWCRWGDCENLREEITKFSQNAPTPTDDIHSNTFDEYQRYSFRREFRKRWLDPIVNRHSKSPVNGPMRSAPVSFLSKLHDFSKDSLDSQAIQVCDAGSDIWIVVYIRGYTCLWLSGNARTWKGLRQTLLLPWKPKCGGWPRMNRPQNKEVRRGDVSLLYISK